MILPTIRPYLSRLLYSTVTSLLPIREAMYCLALFPCGCLRSGAEEYPRDLIDLPKDKKMKLFYIKTKADFVDTFEMFERKQKGEI